MEVLAFIPSLSSDSTNITDPEGIIRYVLRHYLMAPKNISDTFRELEISFMYDVSLMTDENHLTQLVEESLTNVLTRYFQTGQVILNATSVQLDQGAIAIQITVSVIINANTYAVDASVTVTANGDVDFNL